MSNFDLPKIQESIKKLNLDGWLIFDFRRSNDYAVEVLSLPKEAHFTRRFYYYIPQQGEPTKIVNGIESFLLNYLPGKKLEYSNRESLEKHLTGILKPGMKIAMEYSPMNNIPYVSKVDAGTIELIKSFGVEIHSSGDLISLFSAVWTKEQYEENKTAADALYDIVELSFAKIKKALSSGTPINEYEVQQFIMQEFERRNMVTDSPAIVGVNENAANPHYEPGPTEFKQINKGDFVLIDLWAKMNTPNATMADITWVGFAGDKPLPDHEKVAAIVFEARDAAFSAVEKAFNEGREIRGYEVDDAARNVIEKAGYGQYFIHRTGHSITTETHGSGANMDNFETKDERLILPSTSFSIEPGIYLPGNFGVRSEIDVFISPEGKALQTGKERQKKIVSILA